MMFVYWMNSNWDRLDVVLTQGDAADAVVTDPRSGFFRACLCAKRLIRASLRTTRTAARVVLVAMLIVGEHRVQATGGPLRGYLFDSATSQGLADEAVILLRNGAVAAETHTDDAGRFSFPVDPSVRYTLRAEVPGYLSLFSEEPFNPDETPRTIWLTRAAAISGTVFDDSGRPLRGVKVAALVRRGGRVDFAGPVAYTDGQGAYRLHGLAPGAYGVAALPDQSELDSASFAPVYFPSTTDQGRAEWVPLAAGAERRGIDLSLVAVETAVLDGAVTGIPEGWAKQSLAVAILAPAALGAPLAITQTGPDGRFHFARIPEGDYRVVTWGPVVGWGAEGPFAGPEGRQGAVTLRLQGRQEIDIPLEEPGVVMMETEGCADGRLQLVPLEPAAPGRHWGAAIAGTMRIPDVPVGRYRVAVTGGCYAQSLEAGGQARPDGTLVVGRRTNARLRLAEATGRVAGRIEGPLAGGGCVALLPESDGEVRLARAESRFAFGALAPGRYTVILRQPCGSVDSGAPAVVDVRAGAAADIVLEAKP